MSDATHADDDIHALDLGSLGRRRHARDRDRIAGDVDQAALVLAIEVLVVADIGVEAAAAAIDRL